MWDSRYLPPERRSAGHGSAVARDDGHHGASRHERGRDAAASRLRANGVGFGHVRLAVIDLRTASDQPFISDHGTCVLTYNGEIFNYLELRKELDMKCSGAGFLRRRRIDGPFTLGDLIANFGPVPLGDFPNWLQTFVPSYLLCPS